MAGIQKLAKIVVGYLVQSESGITYILLYTLLYSYILLYTLF